MICRRCCPSSKLATSQPQVVWTNPETISTTRWCGQCQIIEVRPAEALQGIRSGSAAGTMANCFPHPQQLKLVKCNLCVGNSKCPEHLSGSLHHSRRAAHVVIYRKWVRVFIQIFRFQDLVDKAGVLVPLIRCFWFRQRNMKTEVGVLLCQILKIFLVENTLLGARAVPVANAPHGLLRFQKIG